MVLHRKLIKSQGAVIKKNKVITWVEICFIFFIIFNKKQKTNSQPR